MNIAERIHEWWLSGYPPEIREEIARVPPQPFDIKGFALNSGATIIHLCLLAHILRIPAGILGYTAEKWGIYVQSGDLLVPLVECNPMVRDLMSVYGLELAFIIHTLYDFSQYAIWFMFPRFISPASRELAGLFDLLLLPTISYDSAKNSLRDISQLPVDLQNYFTVLFGVLVVVWVFLVCRYAASLFYCNKMKEALA